MTTLLLSFLLACSSEIDNKPAASVSEVEKPSSTAKAEATPQGAPHSDLPPAKGTTLPIVNSSTVEFVGAKVTSDHTGGFKRISGNAVVGEDGSLLAIDAQIDMTSIFSDNERLTKHLRNEDFFAVDTYPTAKFSARSFEKTEGSTQVKGNLTLRGVTKEISFAATTASTPTSASINAEFTINRQLWGVSYPGKPDNLIKDDVLIKLNVSYGG